MKKIVVDQNKCIGCGACSFIAPKIFKLGKNGKSAVINQSLQGTKECDEAIASCPVGAISYKDK